MTGKLLLGSLVGAIVLFIWGATWWMGLPFAGDAMKRLPNEEAVGQAIGNLPETGVYFYPMFPENTDDTAATAAFMKKHEAGPLMMINYTKEGATPMDGGTMAMGFFHNLISAILVGMLMLMALPRLTTFGKRLSFVALAGLFAAFFVHLGFPIWFHLPWSYYVTEFFYAAIGWLLAGMAMAAIIKPRVVEPAAVHVTQPAMRTATAAN